MEFRLLGPLEVVDGDEPVRLGGLKQQALLARLLLSANRTLAVDRIVDDIWGEDAPGTAVKMVQIYISQLRKLLPPGLIVTRAPGYVIDVDPEAIDVGAFDRMCRLGRAALDAGDAGAAAAQLREAIGLWRGEALGEFQEPFAQVERRRLEELRRVCLEDRIDADLMSGRHAEVVGELDAAVAEHPLRERLRRQSMLALYRSGRHADALAVYQDFRRVLDEQLGLEPPAALRELEALILRQDPSLALVPVAAPVVAGPDAADSGDVSAGLDALGRGAWDEARMAFERALAVAPGAQSLEGFAQAARFLGDGEASLDARARAFRAYRADGDAHAAARAAAWLAYDTVVFRGDDAVAQGWFGQAHRLLRDEVDSEEHGWLAWLEGEVALIAHADAAAAAEHGRRALEIGRDARIMDLEMLGLALVGLARVAAGEIEEGMRDLDQATAAAVGGELSGLHFAGAIACHMISACERVQDIERAAQWCETATGYSERWNVPQLFGFCRSHYASVLIRRGQWSDAEAELVAASRAFERGAPALVFEGIVRLAELRRRQGRLDEAGELCDRVAWHPAAQLCLAETALDRGDAPGARDLVARHLRALPTGEQLGRAPGLELAIRASLATGDVQAAEAGADELEELAKAAGTAQLAASLRFARGLLAATRGDLQEAKRELEDAIDIWRRVSAPYELARAHIALVDVARKEGASEDAVRELRNAREALAGLGLELEGQAVV